VLTVVKIGGAWLEQGAPAEAFENLARFPGELVLVHGGGKEISRWLDRIGVPVEWADGLRITRGDSLQVTAMVLSGWMNKRLAGALDRAGRPAVGLSGEDAGTIQAVFLDEGKYGDVGRATDVNPAAIRALLTAGFTPVLSPVSRGPDGKPLNVNADEAAIRVAAALEADRLLLVSDVPGVMVEGRLLDSITPAEAERLANDGVISGGMRVKVEQALEAAAAGVDVRIGDEGLLSGSPGTHVRASEGASGRAG
jgi:acetylglutamate kinase